MSKLMGYFVAAAVAASTTALFAAEPFIPVFITDGERNVTPAVFPELSVFRESIPSYPVNSSVKIKRFTPLSKAYKYPQEYVRRLSDEERRLTPYRFEEMFADPASTIDSEYARSGKPFFIYERISRPPYFLPRDGAPLAIRSSFEEWKKKHPGFLGFNSLWELDSDSTYFQRFYNNMKDASIEKELHEAFGPPDEKGMAHRRRWAEKVFKIAEDFHFGEKRIFPLCSNFPGYEHIFAALGAQGIWYEATTQSYGAWNTAGPIVRGAARQRGLDFGWYMAQYYPGFDRKGNRLIGDSRRHLSHDGSDAEPRPYRGESRSMHKRQMLYGWLIGAKYLQTEGWIQFYADKKDGKIIPSENALDFEEAYQRAKRIERGETFTTLAVLTPLDEPTASSYLNKNMIEPTVQADIFDTLVPIRGDSGTDIPKRKIGEQGCLFNSEFGGFFDVLCPDSGQDSAAFAQALSRYRHVLVAGNAFNKDKFDNAALAAFEKSGGKVHRYPSPECPTKDKLRELLLKIQDETMPVSVVGDIQWGVNKTSKGWLVWMINNKGVVKFSDEPEEFRKERTAHVVATFKATGEKFEADIAPGDFKLWEIVQATSAYKPAPAPLMTTWGEAMTPETAWRAYPRPQMTRPGWTCLNGLWKYAVTPVANTSGRPTKWDGEILVPFAPESALSGVGRTIQPNEFLWYTREIVCDPQPGERILLHFDGVDFRAQVYIGHTEVTDVPHFGAQEPFTIDITPYVKKGVNELTVCAWDPTDDFIQSRGKQCLNPRGCFYTRTSGIWQSVWMETVPEAYLADYGVTVDLDKAEATFAFKTEGSRRGTGDVALEVFDGARRVASASFDPDGKGVVKLPKDFKRWTPETPNLYTFKARYGKDEIGGYFAMRSFVVKKDAQGVLRFHLNGAPYFALGTLDQGWWPDGLLTPPSDEAMAHDILTLKKCGFNMMRKHIKVEPRRYYHLCDTLGLLVFQDMPSSDRDWHAPMGAEVVKRYGLYRHELKAMLDNLMKVPSIVAWVPYNEGWSQPGEYLTHATLDFVRRYDPSRPVDGPSGCWDWEGGHLLPKGWAWTNRVETAHKPAGVCEASDMVDMHLYRGPTMFAVNDRRASFLGEFGGLGHVVSNHLWKAANTWGYGGLRDTATREGLEKAYLGLMDQLTALAARGLAGSVYTQTTDVEIEINGLMTYDRKVLKFNPEVLAAAHRKVMAMALKGMEGRGFEEMVPMKDGTKLYTYGVLPPEGVKCGIVLRRTPYVPEKPADVAAFVRGQQKALARGYAYIVQHVRGTGMSEGDWIPYVNERADGLTTLEWLRRLPCYNGEIYLTGGSYLSSVHWSYLGTNPPDVKGAVLNIQEVNRYNIHYRNGHYKSGLHGNWAVKGYKKKNHALKRDPSVKFTDLPLKGFSIRRLGERVADMEDVWEHPRPEDAWWKTTGTAGGEFRRALLDSTMPVLMVTGFYDIYTEGLFDMWRETPPARRANCALVVDAFDHSGRRPDDAVGSSAEFPGGSRKDVGAIDSELDWFDWCRQKNPLKTIRPGETCWYALWENKWHHATEMTAAPQKVSFALTPDRRLIAGTASAGPAVPFDYDPSNPPSFPGAGCLTFGGLRAQPEPGFRKDVLSFVSAPLERRLDVRGQMKLRLAVTSDCDDTAFYVRVSVRKADGKWYTLRDDIKSISWDTPNYAPGTEATIDYTLSDHAFRLEKGDCLRLDVAGANVAAFIPHTNFKGPFVEQAKSRVAHNAVVAEKCALVLPAAP